MIVDKSCAKEHPLTFVTYHETAEDEGPGYVLGEVCQLFWKGLTLNQMCQVTRMAMKYQYGVHVQGTV